MSKQKSNIPSVTKTPSPGIVAMRQRGGKGSHGPGKRATRRQDRQQSKRDLRHT